MGGLRKLWRKLKFITRRRQFERDLDEEMRFHREMLEPGTAGFGNATLLKETSREVWGFRTFETFLKDLQYALRMLRRSPAFTVIAVLSLALGIGANTAIFSLIDALMLKMLPAQQPERLVELLTVRTAGASGFNFFSYPTYEAFRDRNHVFSNVFASATDKFYVMASGGEPESVEGQYVSGNFFAALGIRPLIGQLIAPGDDVLNRPNAVAVLGYAYWKRRFGLDPSLIGKTLTIEGVPLTIIGITPPSFFGIQVARTDDISIPLSMQPRIRPPSRARDAGSKWIRLMGRLKPGASIAQANAEVATIFSQTLSEEISGMRNPADAAAAATMRTWTAKVIAGGNGISRLRREFSRPLVVLMVIVGLVLLIACANVANLLLARATARQKEISTRIAIGAGRVRLLRQMLTESVLLACLGGALGLVLAWWGSNYLIAFMATGRDPIRIALRPDARMLVFTMAVSLLTAVLFGLAPALRASTADIRPIPSHGFRHRLGKALVISQVVVSVLLLAGAGLFTRTLISLETLDVGFERSHVLLVSLDPSHSGYTAAQRTTLYQQLLQDFNAIPGVRSTSVSWIAPIAGGGANRAFSIDGQVARPGQDRSIYINWISPRYFETLGIPLLLGRGFTARDDQQSEKVAVINESMAQLFFGNANPLGRRIIFAPGDLREIVGVVKDTKYLELRETPPPTMYLDTFQENRPDSEFELRTAADSASIVAAARRKVHDLTNGRITVRRTYTLAEQVDASIVQERLIAMLSSFFGAMGLLLACIGLYGLLAYAVARRSNEIGIRIALGAARHDVVRMVLHDALLLVAIGLAIGIPAALACARWISSQLYGVSAHDPLTMAGSAIVLLVVAFIAAWLPARRASRVEPMVALRYE